MWANPASTAGVQSSSRRLERSQTLTRYTIDDPHPNLFTATTVEIQDFLLKWQVSRSLKLPAYSLSAHVMKVVAHGSLLRNLVAYLSRFSQCPHDFNNDDEFPELPRSDSLPIEAVTLIFQFWWKARRGVSLRGDVVSIHLNVSATRWGFGMPFSLTRSLSILHDSRPLSTYVGTQSCNFLCCGDVQRHLIMAGLLHIIPTSFSSFVCRPSVCFTPRVF